MYFLCLVVVLVANGPMDVNRIKKALGDPAKREAARHEILRRGAELVPVLRKVKDSSAGTDVGKRAAAILLQLRAIEKLNRWASFDIGGEFTASGHPRHVRDRRTGIELVLIDAGSYERGYSENDPVGPSRKPRHTVTITRPFYIGVNEVSKGVWERTMNSDPGIKFLGERLPMANVSWTDANLFCRRTGFRLPTEAEWEYVARTHHPIGDPPWHEATSDEAPRDVDKGKTNAVGVRNMRGNVAEWCSDWYEGGGYGRYAQGARDPTGPAVGKLRIFRGGIFDVPLVECHYSMRKAASPRHRSDAVGIRVVRTAPELKD